MNIKHDRCHKIFEKIDIELPDNIIFTYLWKSKIKDESKTIYLLLDNFMDELNNKGKMGELLNDERITPKIYTSSGELLKGDYDDNKIWFIKYINGSCGRHIMCKTTGDLRSIEISSRFIIQEGVTDLDLYKGYKYTLRVFTLIHNKKFYLYGGLKKRVHGEKYDKNSLDYPIQVCGSNYSERIPIYLDKNEILYQKLYNHSLLVKDKIINIINETDKYKYMLIGNDYLVKENKDVILIEMNHLPNLVNSDEINEKINIPLMKNTINLVVNNELNNYEIIN